MNLNPLGLNNYPPKGILGKTNDSLYGLVEGGEYVLSSLLGGILGAGGKLATLGLSKAMTGDADLDFARLVENKINNAIVRQPTTDEGKFWAGELNKPRSIAGSTPTSIMSVPTDISTELTDKFINEPMNLNPTSREVVNTIAPFAVPVISGKVLKTINGDVGGIAKSAKANVDNYVNKTFDPLDLGIPETPGQPYSIVPETLRENGFALQRNGIQFLPQDLLDPWGLNKKPVTPEEMPATANTQTIITPTPEEFIEARDKTSRPQFLTPYTEQQLSGMKLFKVNNADAGYALKDDGDLVNVFNNSSISGLGKKIINDAISNGASKLDCYDDFLPRYYNKFGFKEVRREPWNDKYKPAQWLDKDGKPDVIYMELEREAIHGDNTQQNEGTSSGEQSSGQSGNNQRTSGLGGRNNSEEGRKVYNEQQASPSSRMGVRSSELVNSVKERPYEIANKAGEKTLNVAEINQRQNALRAAKGVGELHRTESTPTQEVKQPETPEWPSPGEPASVAPYIPFKTNPESTNYKFVDENARIQLPAQEAPIVNKVGNPYRTTADAQRIMENKGLADTHEVIPYKDGFASQRNGVQFLPQDSLDPLGLNKKPVTPEEMPSINEAGSSNVPPNMVQNFIYQTSEPNANITKQQITDFVDQHPQVIDKDRLNKATYKIQSEHDVDSIVSAARKFITTFKEYSRDNPIIGKYGHKIYFEPDSRSIERLGSQNDVWIEYALHSTTSTAGDNYRARFFDKSKINNINNIESIIKDADGYYNEDGKTYYYKRVREGKKPNAAIVLEFSNNGKFEDYRYVTQLPNRKKFSASSVKPAAEDLRQKQSGGTPSPIRANNIAHQNESVNDLLSTSEAGTEQTPYNIEKSYFNNESNSIPTSLPQGLLDPLGLNKKPAMPEEMPAPAKMSNNFVTSPDGKIDFGNIPAEIEEKSGGKYPEAPIRMEIGNNDYGWTHIANAKGGRRLQDIKDAGYSGVNNFVGDVAKNYNQIWQQPNGRLMLLKRNGNAKVAVVELADNNDHYGVITALMADKGYPARGGRELLWERSEPISASPEKSTPLTNTAFNQPSQVGDAWRSGQSFNNNVATQAGNVNKKQFADSTNGTLVKPRTVDGSTITNSKTVDNNVYRETKVPVPDEVFKMVGAPKGNVYADYKALQNKHPDQFSSSGDVKDHVEYVMDNPTGILPATKDGYTMLYRSNGVDKATVVEFNLRGGKYRVYSAYTLNKGQLGIKIQKAQRGVPEPDPANPTLTEINEPLTQGGGVPSDTRHVELSGNNLALTRGKCQ